MNAETINNHFQCSKEKQMSQNVSGCPTEKFRLSDKQLAAIDLLASGLSDSDIALAIDINRRTLYRWRQHNPLFQAELNRRRQALWQNSADRLRSLLSPALDILEKQLKDPYDRTAFRAAINVLRLAGTKKIAPPAGPDDEDQILKNLVLAERREENFTQGYDCPPTRDELNDMLRHMLQKAEVP
jgi:transposase-like protein